MKVEFTAEEVWQMMDSVVGELVQLNLGKKDRAALRRWRSDDMALGALAMTLLTEKVNAELRRVHERSEVSPIRKPDWV